MGILVERGCAKSYLLVTAAWSHIPQSCPASAQPRRMKRMPRLCPSFAATLFYFTFASALIDLVFPDVGGRLGHREGGDDGHLGRRGHVDGHPGLRGSGVGGRGHIHGWDRSSSSSYSVGDKNSRVSRLVELSEGRSHSLEEFHKSEMMLQAMTSRVGKMLGNMMDSGAMKVALIVSSIVFA